MKILLIGGTGTIGKSIAYQGSDDFVAFARKPVPWIQTELGTIERYSDIVRAIKKHDIEGIIHLAANKHIGCCEEQPTQAIYNNINGSLNVLRAIEETNIKRAVLISTDKACEPTSVYGMSKFIVEKLVMEYALGIDAHINSLRLGNVFGSSGSVFPLWMNSINEITLRRRAGNPMLKFALTPKQVGKICLEVFNGNHHTGATVVPKMPVLNIDTLAQVFADFYNYSIKVEDSLDCEKQHEALISSSELIVEHDNFWEIGEHAVKYLKKGYDTSMIAEMDYAETQIFFNQVKEEMELLNL